MSIIDSRDTAMLVSVGDTHIALHFNLSQGELLEWLRTVVTGVSLIKGAGLIEEAEGSATMNPLMQDYLKKPLLLRLQQAGHYALDIPQMVERTPSESTAMESHIRSTFRPIRTLT